MKYCILVFILSSHQASVQAPSKGQWPLQAVTPPDDQKASDCATFSPLGLRVFSLLVIIIFSIKIRMLASLFLYKSNTSTF